ncbi:hypothetical protein [Shewanella sp. UCD-KL12]|uniref:hypothetical protein n=1 Tax=Shewanella sp. UCD-KL12 TaxID=1917163 RepID=UPI000970785F|nr:hypothetical protein [Shewanella sp. UCD-KL12]
MLNMIRKLFSTSKSKVERTPADFLTEWSKNPEKHFYGENEKPLIWSTTHGFAPGLNREESRYGLSSFPNLKNVFVGPENDLTIGNVEGICMYGGGIVKIRHFALRDQLTEKNIGILFFEAILLFFKEHNATVIEFHESHSTKIEHYRRFFEKQGIEEIENRVWRVDLYKGTEIPESVLKFQHSLLRTKEAS